MAQDNGGSTPPPSGGMGTPPDRGGKPTPKAPKPAPKPAAPKPAPKPKGTPNSNGLSRSQIIALQKKIGVTPDGVFGPQTQAALITWQGKNGLTPDGIPGPLTLAKAGVGSGSTGAAPKAGTGGSTGSKAATPPASTTPKLSDQEMAANYGWSLAVLNSDPELKDIFQQAVAGTWSQSKFIARLQDTQWYKTHGEAWRQNEVLRNADPATYNQRKASATAKIVQESRAYGVTLTAGQAAQMAMDYMGFGWNEDQLRQHLAAYASYSNTNSALTGEAGAKLLEYKRIAADYGLNPSEGQLNYMVRGTVAGTVDSAWVTEWAKKQAKSAFPALQARIDAGETVASIADPYKQAYSKVLEVNPNTINLNDRLLKQALQGKDAKGQPATQSLWQFEDTLRNDSRWSKTQNARDSAAATTHGVLQSFGLVS